MTRVRETTGPELEQRRLLTPRAQRNHVRIPLAVECGEHALSAETVNASESGLAIHVYPQGPPPQAGDIISVRTTVTRAEPVHCRVVWVDHEELNAFGEPVIAIGACFMERHAVAGFLAEANAARHLVLLLVGDDELGDHIAKNLASYCRVVRPRTCANAMSALLTDNVSVLLCDETMPHPGPAEFLSTVRDSFPRAPWVSVVAGTNLQAPQLSQLINVAHVFRYLHKPFADAQLVTDVRAALGHYDLSREGETVRRELERANHKLEREMEALRKARAAD